MAAPSRQTLWITTVARFFTLFALGAPVLWYRDASALLALIAIGIIWVNATLQENEHWLTLVPMTTTVEAALIGLVCGLSVAASPTILLALAIPPFIAAVRTGLRSMVLALAAEVAVAVVASLVVLQEVTIEQGFDTFTWAMAGLGLGLIGSFIHSTTIREADELAPYLDAQHLIRQLIDLSGDLQSGLDVQSVGGGILSTVRDDLPAAALALYVPRGEVLTPVISTTSSDDDLQTAESLAVDAWALGDVVVVERAFAFPLGDSAVVGGEFSETADLPQGTVTRRIGLLTTALRPQAVQLDTALLFSDFRDSATADVRQRLAREMHDGVAQDIASLGYLVDVVAAKPASDKQAEQLTLLRERITKIVAEVRESVLTLRTSVGESESLGVAIGAIARHLSESSQIPIQVTLDEHSSRLRPEVEAELFRIAQESMNNAIKHAQATTIEVSCQVYAPDARITITDDGRGLQKGRSDSYGLKIMRERARLAGADLTIGANSTGGLVVTAQIGSEARFKTPPRSANTERVAP